MSYPVDRFAAFAAHCLNDSGPDGWVRIDPGSLYFIWVDALAKRYAAPVLQHARYADRMEAEEAAERYFRATLERGLFQAAQADFTAAQLLFLALCRRAGGNWAEARLERRTAISAATVPLHVPGEWKAVSARLAACDHTISQTNAATSHRNRFGPMMLICGACATPLPEQMSAWDAVRCAPRLLAKLPDGATFNEFCSLCINVLRTTNRPFQEVLSLGHGLCPFEWLDLPVNQVRGVGRFLKALESGGGANGDWDQAWTEAPVPGYKSCDLFKASDLGAALRQGPLRQVQDEDWATVGAEDPQFDSLLEADDFRTAVALLIERTVVTAQEAQLLLGLYRGEALEQLQRRPDLAAWFAKGAIERRLAELQFRIEMAE